MVKDHRGEIRLVNTGPFAAIAATLGLLGAILLAAGLSRGSRLRPLGPAMPAGVLAPGTARLWICVTPASYCSSPPRPTGEPCTCLDPWNGWVAGRVWTDRSPASSKSGPWPSRPSPEAEEPPASTRLETP
jgi:hypothetical protein